MAEMRFLHQARLTAIKFLDQGRGNTAASRMVRSSRILQLCPLRVAAREYPKEVHIRRQRQGQESQPILPYQGGVSIFAITLRIRPLGVPK